MTTGLRAPMPTREGIVERPDGVGIYWQAWLPADKPHAIVVLNHGLLEHGGRYGYAVSALVGAGHGVYALDARGHGRSGGRRATVERFEELVADLDAVLQAAVWPAHSGPVFLMGYSMGGSVAVAYALDHQDDLAGAIVIGCALGAGTGISRLQLTMASLLSAALPRCPLIRVRGTDMNSDPVVAEMYEVDPLVHHGRINARFVGELLAAIRRLPGEFPRLRLPLLVLHGAADITASPEGSQGLYEGAASVDKTLTLYEGGRHDLLNERGHQQVMDDVVAWLGRKPAYPAHCRPFRAGTGGPRP
jgi:acylglycerol lipase